MDLIIRDNGKFELDMWGRHIKAGRQLRPAIWAKAMAVLQADGHSPKGDATAIRDLFLDLRIDLERALTAIEADCDTGVIVIDPRPEAGNEHNNAALRDELENHNRVMAAVFAETGRDSIDHFDPKDAELVANVRKRLQDAKALRPGVLGI